jgi:hypothetical protein
MKPKGHDFQEARPEYLRSNMVGRVSPALKQLATGTYRGAQSFEQPVLAEADPAYRQELRALRRQAEFQNFGVQYTTEPQLILPRSDRVYLIIQNLDAAAILFVGFGSRPTTTFGIRVLALGNYEPFVVPQNDVWLTGSAPGTAVIAYANNY